jgi:sigma-E factor negative regulatory protein RseB
LRVFPLLFASLIFSPATTAANPAYDWLMKMNQATRELTYDGTFVYQHGEQLEAMRIIHRVDQGSVNERLVSLNGAAREVIRDDRQVMCYLPDRRSVVVEHRLGREKSFPAIVPEQVLELNENYLIKLGGAGRVAGRETQLVVIKPRDRFRYGYHLWADKRTGLLLKADLVDHTANVLEQFMFAQVVIGGTIDAADLNPAVAAEGLEWYWGSSMEAAPSNLSSTWKAKQLPTGFMLMNRVVRRNPKRSNPVEHLVYSDGLAAVSVFIEKMDGKAKPAMKGASRMGAVHAYGNVVSGHQIIVVGEVPEATVQLVGKSMVMQPQ